MYHFLPPPPPRTRQDKMRDIELTKQQAPLSFAYGAFIIGFLLTGLLLSIFL